MPELPEVETIKSQLNPVLPFKLERVWFSPKTNRMVKTRDLDPTNHVITEITRHGKWLIFKLAPHGYFLSHLGMSGTWRISDYPLDLKHGHIQFMDLSKESNGVLTYEDPRRFGHFYILSDLNFKKKFEALPVDISSAEFTLEHFALILFSNAEKVIKPFLLDQNFFPGVGNYIASEICARGGILPTRPCGSLTSDEISKTYHAFKTVLDQALNTGGTTFGGGYRDTTGSKGEGVKNLVVFYQEYCQMCLLKNVKTKVVKTVMNTRGTYHCPHCQK